jgi:hypothetical protein
MTVFYSKQQWSTAPDAVLNLNTLDTFAPEPTNTTGPWHRAVPSPHGGRGTMRRQDATAVTSPF